MTPHPFNLSHPRTLWADPLPDSLRDFLHAATADQAPAIATRIRTPGQSNGVPEPQGAPGPITDDNGSPGTRYPAQITALEAFEHLTPTDPPSQYLRVWAQWVTAFPQAVQFSSEAWHRWSALWSVDPAVMQRWLMMIRLTTDGLT